MEQNKSNIALLLGDPAGIGPELISKLLKEEVTNKANIVVIGEKQILESGNNITGNSHQLEICLLYTSPSPRDPKSSRMPSSA